MCCIRLTVDSVDGVLYFSLRQIFLVDVFLCGSVSLKHTESFPSAPQQSVSLTSVCWCEASRVCALALPSGAVPAAASPDRRAPVCPADRSAWRWGSSGLDLWPPHSHGPPPHWWRSQPHALQTQRHHSAQHGLVFKLGSYLGFCSSWQVKRTSKHQKHQFWSHCSFCLVF